jgi:hypothetical protein
MSLIQFLGKDKPVISSQTARARNQILLKYSTLNENKLRSI